MYYAAHSSCVGYDTDHDVLQPDAAYYDKFAFVPDKDRYVMFALNCLPSTVRPQMFALNCCPQLFALS